MSGSTPSPEGEDSAPGGLENDAQLNKVLSILGVPSEAELQTFRDERMKAVVPPTAGPKTEADSSNLDDLKALTKKAAKKLEAAEGSGGGPSQKFKIEKTLPSKLAEDKAGAAEKKRKEIEKAVAAAKAKQEAEKQKEAAKAAAASTAGDEEDEDIGEPLGSPQTFEPSDVQFKGGAVPVT